MGAKLRKMFSGNYFRNNLLSEGILPISFKLAFEKKHFELFFLLFRVAWVAVGDSVFFRIFGMLAFLGSLAGPRDQKP